MSVVIDRPVQRTGPALVKDCHLCDGIGKPGCPACKGTGRIVRDLAPFVALGALQEHIGSLQSALGITFETIYGDGVGNRPPLRIGSPEYHLRAIADYAASLFQQLILMLPEEWERTEGD